MGTQSHTPCDLVSRNVLQMVYYSVKMLTNTENHPVLVSQLHWAPSAVKECREVRSNTAP